MSTIKEGFINEIVVNNVKCRKMSTIQPENLPVESDIQSAEKVLPLPQHDTTETEDEPIRC